MAETHKKEKVQ